MQMFEPNFFTLVQAVEDKKDDRSRLAAIIREVDRFLSDGLVKVQHGYNKIDWFYSLVILIVRGIRLLGKPDNGSFKFFWKKIYHVLVVMLQERLEFDFLGDSGIVKNAKKFFNTVIKLKTKLL